MYKILGGSRNRTFRVLWMLEEIGEDYQFISLKPHSSELLKYNVGGKVPVLFDEKVPICESVAIITYLADKHNKLTHPSGTLKRAFQDSITLNILDDIESVLWVAAKNSFVFPLNKRTPEIIENLKWEFAKNLKLFTKRMKNTPWILGDNFSLTDILLTHCLNWAEQIGFLTDETKIKNYLVKTRKRKSYLQVMKIKN